MVQRRAAPFTKTRLPADHFCFDFRPFWINCWPSISDRPSQTSQDFGKAVAGRVAINTGDLVQPLRQTRHSDLDLKIPLLLWTVWSLNLCLFLRNWNWFFTCLLTVTLSMTMLIVECWQYGKLIVVCKLFVVYHAEKQRSNIYATSFSSLLYNRHCWS